jgi:hypothetical protein
MMYEFYYPEYNVRQCKLLIPHSIWLTYRNMPYSTVKEIEETESYLSSYTQGREWFTDQSSYWKAITTGILDANGLHKVIITAVTTLNHITH